jgi:hypothetical protein
MENSLFKKNGIQEDKKVIKDSKFLLSKEYKNFGWLSEKEKSDYLDLQEKAQKGDTEAIEILKEMQDILVENATMLENKIINGKSQILAE